MLFYNFREFLTPQQDGIRTFEDYLKRKYREVSTWKEKTKSNDAFEADEKE
jgi:hypothetical protein